jgi:alpha-aminoadipate carrier protein LysW
MILCPECESSIDIDQDEMDEGEIVSCPECGTDFEVVTTEPFELVRVEDEDMDEDEEERDEDNEDGDM